MTKRKGTNRRETNIRIGYDQFKKFLLQFSGNDKPNFKDIPERTVYYCTGVGTTFGFLKENDSLSLTEKGRDVRHCYIFDDKKGERKILRETLKENEVFSTHWAHVCNNRTEFKISDLITPFRRIGYDDVEDASLIVYIRPFIDWARSAKLCTRIGVKGHTYRILERATIGSEELEGSESEVIVSEEIKTNGDSERELEFSIYKLNTYICDYLSDTMHEADLSLIEDELEIIKESDVWDDLVIEMLEREIETALNTKSPEDFAMVAQSLKSLRDRRIESMVVTARG